MEGSWFLQSRAVNPKLTAGTKKNPDEHKLELSPITNF
jgi:hypothetical protein